MKTIALILLALVLAVGIGRAVWVTAAQGVIVRMQDTFANRNLTDDEFVSALQHDINVTRRLAKTCILVAECTPEHQVQALALIKIEEQRLADSIEYLKIRKQALDLLQQIKGDPNSPLIANYMALKDPYIAIRKKILLDTNQVLTAVNSGNLPKAMIPVFVALD